MRRVHIVRPGDCVLSVAAQHGVTADALWSDPDNARLRQQRGGQGWILLPGDILHVPASRPPAGRSLRIGSTNSYQLPVPRTQLRVHLRGPAGPRANEPFRANIGGVESEGRTDGAGVAEVSVRACDTEGEIHVGTGDNAQSVTLHFGHLDPANEATGALQRLRNLGYAAESAGEPDAGAMAAALRGFQQAHNLPETGALDAATQDRLRAEHQS